MLDHVFRNVGFDAIDDDILKGLVIARLCQPLSKSATVDYLKSYFDEDVELHSIYRYLDRLHNTQQENIQRISVEHTRKILGGKIGIEPRRVFRRGYYLSHATIADPFHV